MIKHKREEIKKKDNQEITGKDWRHWSTMERKKSFEKKKKKKEKKKKKSGFLLSSTSSLLPSLLTARIHHRLHSLLYCTSCCDLELPATALHF